MIADTTFRHDPPWITINPLIPQPINPNQIIDPWKIDRLKEYLEILKEVRDLEEKVGCACEPNKADYIKLFEERIAKLKEEDGPLR